MRATISKSLFLLIVTMGATTGLDGAAHAYVLTPLSVDNPDYTAQWRNVPNRRDDNFRDDMEDRLDDRDDFRDDMEDRRDDWDDDDWDDFRGDLEDRRDDRNDNRRRGPSRSTRGPAPRGPWR